MTAHVSQARRAEEIENEGRCEGVDRRRGEHWHTGQCFLMSIKKQHHDRKLAIKPGSCDGVTNGKDRPMPRLHPSLLHLVFMRFSLIFFPTNSNSFSHLAVTLNFFPFPIPWPLCALISLPDPQGQRCEEHGYGCGLHMSHDNGCLCYWPLHLTFQVCREKPNANSN